MRFAALVVAAVVCVLSVVAAVVLGGIVWVVIAGFRGRWPPSACTT